MMLREDVPAPEPAFGYSLLADSLLAVLREERRSAFVLGLHGPWGAGKTTLMQSLGARIAEDPANIVVQFNAWKYHEREALWRALIIQVLEALRHQTDVNNDELNHLERALYATFNVKEKGRLHVDWGSAVTEALVLAMRIGSANLMPGPVDRVGDWLNRLFNRNTTTADTKADDVAKSIERTGKILSREVTERQVQQVISVEQFLARFQALMAKLGKSNYIYVLVDDLDRCLPDAALEVFEAIKLFLDAPECTYIVALDRDVIRRGLALRYAGAGPGAVDADEYIEKAITLSYDLPPLNPADGHELLRACALGAPLDKAQLDRIVALLGTNPRRLKRFGRSLSVLFAIAQAVPDLASGSPSPLRSEDTDLFVKLALLGYRNSGVFGLMIRDPGLPSRLQQAANRFDTTARASGEGHALTELRSGLEAEHPLVQVVGSDAAFWRILASPPMFEKDPTRVAAALRWYGAKPKVP